MASFQEAQQNKLQILSSLQEEYQNKLQILSSLQEEQHLKAQSFVGNNQSNSFVESVSELYTFWLEINKNFDFWNKCDLLLTCPTTLRGAQELFSDKEIVEIKNFSSLKDFFGDSRDKQYQFIGILSPGILDYLRDDKTLLIHLLQICRHQLVFVTNQNTTSKVLELYHMLHKVGFYEIILRNDEKKIFCSTVGDMLGSSFDVRSNIPGIPVYAHWKTGVASRMAVSKVDDLPWWTAFGLLTFSEQGTSAAPNELALSIKRFSKSEESVSEQFIKGVARWTKFQEGFSAGHASLIGCYTGPGDTNMYAAILQLISNQLISLSLWRNDGEWIRLQEASLSIEDKPLDEQGNFNFPFWLNITESLVSVGTEEKTLLSINDDKLPRYPTLGVRMFDSHISFADLTIEFVRK